MENAVGEICKEVICVLTNLSKKPIDTYAFIWTHVTSLTSLPCFIEVPVPSLESERSCTCVLGAMISIFDFGIVLTGWYVFVFHLSITENTLGEIFEEIT
jgi:hypothetical protein